MSRIFAINDLHSVPLRELFALQASIESRLAALKPHAPEHAAMNALLTAVSREITRRQAPCPRF